MNSQVFMKQYVQRLKTLLDGIDIDVIESIINVFETSIQNNSTIYVIGNGGSASTASHMVNDLNIGLKRRGIRTFNLISLADNTSVITAISNDIGYENIFLSQLKHTLDTNDIIVALSCSGNSPNIIRAVEYAKK